jgi:hypothetical protein
MAGLDGFGSQPNLLADESQGKPEPAKQPRAAGPMTDGNSVSGHQPAG